MDEVRVETLDVMKKRLGGVTNTTTHTSQKRKNVGRITGNERQGFEEMKLISQGSTLPYAI